MAEPNQSSREAKQLIRQTRRYFIFGVMSLAGFWSLIIAHTQTVAADDDAAMKPITLNIRVVDGEGMPIADAYVGSLLIHSYAFTELPADETGWRYASSARTDDQGDANLVIEDGRWLLRHRAIVARVPSRNLFGFTTLDPKAELQECVVVTLKPVVRITGRVTCRQRSERNLSIHTFVRLMSQEHTLLYAVAAEEQFELFASLGDYEIAAEGIQMHEVQRKIRITGGETVVELGDIDLPAAKFGLLQGLPASELEDIAAWQNSLPVRIADLRSRWVLLEFWGHWCGSCLEMIPQLNHLHDEYGATNLTIIGVHVDRPLPNHDLIETVPALQASLAALRTDDPQNWKNLAEPNYPVAITRYQRAPLGNGSNDETRSATGALYGVYYYPTGILIDPEGRVVEEIYVGSDEGVQKLLSYIDPPADALSPIFAKAQP